MLYNNILALNMKIHEDNVTPVLYANVQCVKAMVTGPVHHQVTMDKALISNCFRHPALGQDERHIHKYTNAKIQKDKLNSIQRCDLYLS